MKTMFQELEEQKELEKEIMEKYKENICDGKIVFEFFTIYELNDLVLSFFKEAIVSSSEVFDMYDGCYMTYGSKGAIKLANIEIKDNKLLFSYCDYINYYLINEKE